MNELIGAANQDIAKAQSDFQSSRTFFTRMVIAFSATSVIVALLLGFVLSWAFIVPVRRMQRALAGITAGNLKQHVDVPNRDEFGQLATDLNGTSDRLETLFDDQRKLTTQLSKTNASLVDASEAKSRFLANVSHELRTPMTSILGFTDALLAGVDGPLSEEQKESLRWVQRGGQDLLGLINEILDLSKIEAGKMTIDAEPFDPGELVESVMAQHRSFAAQKRIRLESTDVGTPAEVVLDRQRVRQILVNLVGNALEVHRPRRSAGRVRRSGRREVPHLRPRHRARHRARAAEGDLRRVPPVGGSGTRHRPRPDHQPPSRAIDGRRRHRRQRARTRKRLSRRPADGLQCRHGRRRRYGAGYRRRRRARPRPEGRAVVATILVVEDTPANRALATKLLQRRWPRGSVGRHRCRWRRLGARAAS